MPHGRVHTDAIALPGAEPAAGRGLLRLVPLAAIATLLVNDHVLKAAAPGFVTGKLSDVAGLVFFPLLLVAVLEFVLSAAHRRIDRPHRLLAGAIMLTGVVFALIKVVPAATDVWAVGLGLGQWPFASIGAMLSGSPVVPWRPVGAVTDSTDLVAMVALGLAWLDGRRRLAVARPPTGRRPFLRTRLLPIAAILAAGVATLATTAVTPTTTVELPISVVLDADHPVAVRTFEVTVDTRGYEAMTGTSVTVEAVDTDVRYALFDGQIQGRTDVPSGAATPRGVRWPRCDQDPCTRTVTVLTERLQPTGDPLTATATLKASVASSEMEVELPADRISIVERGTATFQEEPSLVTTGVAGQDVLSPANPVVVHRFTLHLEPGVVKDPGRLFLDGRLGLEAIDGPTAIGLDAGVRGLGEWGKADLSRAAVIPIDDVGRCPKDGPCDLEYELRLKAGPATTEEAPSTVAWRITLDLLDYAVEAAPATRSAAVTLDETVVVGGAATTLRQSLSGHYEVTGDRRAHRIPYVVTLDPSIIEPADGKRHTLLVTHTMTIGGTEADGARSHTPPALHLRLGRAPYMVGVFDGDGRPHTYRRYDLVDCKTTCTKDYDFDVFIDGDGVKTPVGLDWELEIAVTAWDGTSLPADATFSLETGPPKD